MKRKIRILIVDDHAMVRFALAEAIAGEADLTLVAEAANGTEALALYRKHQPDVVTMDFQLPGADGAESTAKLRAEFPDARVVLLSVFEGEEDIWRAVQAGALGYVPKSAEIAEVLEGIRELAAGREYFPAAIAATSLPAAHAAPSPRASYKSSARSSPGAATRKSPPPSTSPKPP